MKKYDYYKLFVTGNPGDPHRYVVKGYGTWEKYSVLAGQVKITFLDSFATEAQARETYPDLKKDGTEYGNKYLDPVNTFDHLSDEEGSY